MKLLLAAALALGLIAGPAVAQTIDMTVPITDENGKPMPDASAPRGADDPTCAKCPPFTAAQAIIRALLMSDEKDPADQKWGDAALAMRIRDDPGHVTLKSEEAARIKKKLGRFGGLVIYQLFPLIDPNAQPPAVKP